MRPIDLRSKLSDETLAQTRTELTAQLDAAGRRVNIVPAAAGRVIVQVAGVRDGTPQVLDVTRSAAAVTGLPFATATGEIKSDRVELAHALSVALYGDRESVTWY
jgi:hypothetical protein